MKLRFRSWQEIREVLEVVEERLHDRPRIIVIGDTALCYHGLKQSTKDLHFVFPTQGECFWFADALSKMGYDPRKGARVLRFTDFERDLYVDLSYGMVGEVLLTQPIFSRLIEEKIRNVSVWIPSLEDLFILKACHSMEDHGTDVIGDAKRIYGKIDMKIVEGELRNQSERVEEKVNRWLEEFGEGARSKS
ncbi:MAG: nucleotidyltransferase [Candidatus Methanospirareceae archaeon]